MKVLLGARVDITGVHRDSLLSTLDGEKGPGMVQCGLVVVTDGSIPFDGPMVPGGPVWSHDPQWTGGSIWSNTVRWSNGGSG